MVKGEMAKRNVDILGISELRWAGIDEFNSDDKALMLGKIEGRRTRGRQRMRWLDASLTHWT